MSEVGKRIQRLHDIKEEIRIAVDDLEENDLEWVLNEVLQKINEIAMEKQIGMQGLSL